MAVMVEVAIGELVDKLTILEIKLEQIKDEAKLANVRAEFDILARTRREAVPDDPRIETLTRELKAVNEALWHIEDDIRDCERAKDFGPRFVALARSVYRTNDQRSQIKRQINDHLNSGIVEEKSYADY